MIKINLKINIFLFSHHINLKMAHIIKDNGKTAKDMEEGNNYGMMDHYMKDIGGIIWPMVKED